MGPLVLIALALCGIAGYSLFVRPGSEPVVTDTAPSERDSPADAGTHTELAAALASAGRHDEAVRHFQEAIRLEPDRAEGHLNLGNTLARQEKFAEAIPHYRRATQLRPDYAKAHNNLAVALKETGRLAAAHEHIQEALRLKRRTEQPTESARLPEPATSAIGGQAPTSADAAVAVLTTRSLESRHRAGLDLLDPQKDGWETEVLAERAGKQLGRLTALLGNTAPVEPTLLNDVAAAAVSSSDLRPAGLTEVFRDGSLVVRRGEAAPSKERAAFQGHEGLRKAFGRLAAPLAGASNIHTHVKVVRATLIDGTARTTAVLAVNGQTRDVMVEQHVTLICHWTRDENDLLKLTSIRAEDYQEVEARGRRWFADCTTAVLGGNPSFAEQLVPGLNHWLARVERVRSMHIFARYGVAIGDVNGDDLEDVYVCQPGGLPNRLFVQNPDGTCEDRSKRAGVDWLDHTSSALFVDLDNDGDQDLVAATLLGLVTMENDGTGGFERRAVLPLTDIDLHALSAADYDGDGDLDLYICIDFSNQASGQTRSAVGFVYHDANDGGANHLFRNDIPRSGGRAEWKFTDVTKETGLGEDNHRHSLAAAWEDYDGDGDPDLYVANDYGQNCLYRNDGGRFKNVASEAGVVDFGSGMSVSWGDYNRDGWMDIYVGNMFSSAGNRITRQERFKSEAREETRALYQRFAKGNSLFENRGDGTFREVGAEAAVEMGRWAWSSLFADLNNDGWEDLLVANGYITTEDTGDL